MPFSKYVLSKLGSGERLLDFGRWSMEKVVMPSMMIGVFTTAALAMVAIGLWQFAVAWLAYAVDWLGKEISEKLEKGVDSLPSA